MQSFGDFAKASSSHFSWEFPQLFAELDALEIVKNLDSDTQPPDLGPALLLDCFGLIKEFKDFRIQHSPRDCNTAADRLAKLGHEFSPGVTTFREAPSEILNILYNDSLGLVP